MPCLIFATPQQDFVFALFVFFLKQETGAEIRRTSAPIKNQKIKFILTNSYCKKKKNEVEKFTVRKTCASNGEHLFGVTAVAGYLHLLQTCNSCWSKTGQKGG